MTDMETFGKRTTESDFFLYKTNVESPRLCLHCVMHHYYRCSGNCILAQQIGIFTVLQWER